MEETKRIDGVVGQTNVYQLDADIALVAGSQITFEAMHVKGGTPVVSKTRGSGIGVTDEPTGQFQVTLDPTDLQNLTYDDALGHPDRPVRSLWYRVTIDPLGDGKYQEVLEGSLILVD